MCGRSRGYMDTGNGNGEVGVKGSTGVCDCTYDSMGPVVWDHS